MPNFTRAAQRDANVLTLLDGQLAAHGPEALLTRQQLASVFGVPERSVTRWSGFIVHALPRHYAADGDRLPRQGRLHLYRVADVRAWVAEGYAPFPGRPTG